MRLVLGFTEAKIQNKILIGMKDLNKIYQICIPLHLWSAGAKVAKVSDLKKSAIFPRGFQWLTHFQYFNFHKKMIFTAILAET